MPIGKGLFLKMNSEGNIMITRMSAYYMNVIIFTIASHEIFAQIIFRSRTTKKEMWSYHSCHKEEYQTLVNYKWVCYNSNNYYYNYVL